MSIGDRIRPTIIRAAERIETRWKNGGGLAREVIRLEDQEGWVWRLSLATVASDGPFSLFPGYDRLLMLIEGQPMRLDFGDGERLLIEKGYPNAFSCDRPVSARLQSSSCEDLNLIWRRRDLRGEAQFLVLSGELLQILQPASWHIYTISSGSVVVTIGSEDRHELHAGDTLVLHDASNSQGLKLAFVTGGAEFAALKLSPAS